MFAFLPRVYSRGSRRTPFSARTRPPPPTRRIVCFISLTVNTEIRPKNAENRIFMRNNDFIIYTHIYIYKCVRVYVRENFLIGTRRARRSVFPGIPSAFLVHEPMPTPSGSLWRRSQGAYTMMMMMSLFAYRKSQPGRN